ncbi:nucleoside diphosphate kinase homolog 5 isoform X2 [Hydra vulgaris]|uniref:Nucleoside diphosphate kinase homolog 5 isoform X2 n=1 Tax=Hydra vulgaris TaxID=6087 RepID=A0ABM4D822_HYDVU
MNESTTFINIEQTLALIKPDAIDYAEEIEDIMLSNGFLVLQKRRVQLTPEQSSDFYAEHSGKIFFPSLVAFMSSGESIAYLLARNKAIEHWRKIIGPTNSAKARDEVPTSIRALYGTDNYKNAVHGSDSLKSAFREIQFFFPNGIIEPILSNDDAKDYLRKYVNPTLLKGLIQLCKRKPIEPIIWLSDWLASNNPYRPRIVEPENPIVQEPI